MLVLCLLGYISSFSFRKNEKKAHESTALVLRHEWGLSSPSRGTNAEGSMFKANCAMLHFLGMSFKRHKMIIM